MNEVPNEVIIVEGRDDTKRLIETFGNRVKTIETNGSAISHSTLAQIKQAAEEFGIIIFTDPDYQGDRIRRIVSQAIPYAKHAYLSQEEAQSGQKGRSLGVEHASTDTIRQALSQVMIPQDLDPLSFIPMSQLLALKLIAHPKARRNRDLVARHFNLGHTNGKQLQKRLAQYQVSYQDLIDYMEALNND